MSDLDGAGRNLWDHVSRPQGIPETPPGGMCLEPGEVGRWSTYLLLNDGATDVWVHWFGNRSLPCLNALGSCPEELHVCKLAWRAYIAGVNVRTGATRLLSITYDAARSCPEFCCESGLQRLRGRLLAIIRTEGKKVQPQRIKLLDDKWNKPVPPDRSVMPALQILWGSHPLYRKWIAENVTGCDPDETFPHPQRPNP